MHPIKTLSQVLFVSLVVGATTASAATAEATIDWSSFTVRLLDLDPADGITPSITWTNQYSYTYASVGGDYENSPLATDWSSPTGFSATTTSANADSDLLSAFASSGPAGAWTSVSANRDGYFDLSANTAVIFSVAGTVAFDPLETSADIVMQVFGTGAFGLGTQQSRFALINYDYGADPTQSGAIATSFVNLTSGTLTGSLLTYAYVSAAPVPEPESYAMFLAGLGLMGLVARRRT